MKIDVNGWINTIGQGMLLTCRLACDEFRHGLSAQPACSHSA